MSAPVRPDPDPIRPRLGERIQNVFDRSRLVRPAATASPPLDDQRVHETPAFSSRWLTAVVICGAVLTTLGVLLAWQSWANRSAPPIDDQLPFLDSAATEPTTTPPAETAEAPATSSVTLDEPASTAQTAGVVVHVAGAVAEPGVVSLPSGSRVFQAIELAGGASQDADLNRVNLAAPLIDGERIHVPEVGEEIIPAQLPPPFSEAGLSTVPDSIDINTAGVVELELLRGIGPSLAQAIVTTRTERGPFRSVDELLSVPGIGEAKLAQIRDQIVVR